LVVDGVAHDERDGWCFQLDSDDYPVPQYDICNNIEEAKIEVLRRIKMKMRPLEKTIEYINKEL
jgi:hypothetical protein